MFKIFGFTKKNKEIIRRCYLTALEREPDEVGLNHYLKMMRSIIKPNGIDEKKLIKQKNKESAERRRAAKRKDKVARWGGIILLGLIMFVGFLLWVSGETL